MDQRELDHWRDQWADIAVPLPDVQERIRRHNRRFVLENALALLAATGGLAFAAYVSRQSWLGRGWGVAIAVFMFFGLATRAWSQRGTWRAQSQSTRAFAELWRKRIIARIRLLRIAVYASAAWLIACAILTAVNWKVIEPHFRTHTTEWLLPLLLSALMLPLLFRWAAWLGRRKLAELEEVDALLAEMRE